ncbi:thioredoxin family protein [Kordiimonas sp. SCSIO 12603]|uniref:thioredoxin family protein n=1 Tax=Kordiimonas sp. SCSIO 12603 TaxID=2829596 RepID=UPI002104855C|nr:thioredoxin family protein [Kordiimonas sp. SCSIO 12603]UTW58306.1 thioredoxin family protein [Kordiimonas sp. SCSIO 12603]
MAFNIIKSGAIAAALFSFTATHNVYATVDSGEEHASKLSYKPSQNAMADVEATLAKAKANGKLAMVIMGANWCHDSMAFLRRLESPEMQELVANRYEYAIVDVGYLENGSEIIQRFGKPVIYGTPTVLIINPENNKLLNNQNTHRWRDADSISVSDTVSYFAKLPVTGEAAEVSNPKLKALLAEINTFEKEQSLRVYRGFNLIGPMMELGKSERPKGFYNYWGQLRDFRYQITKDLDALKTEAAERVAAGEENITLSYPTYEPFDWEKEGFSISASE